jgi:hypothetical protein
MKKDIRPEKSSSFLMFRNHQLIVILSAMKKPEATKIGKEEVEKMLKRFSNGKHRRIIFSDEKLFSIDGEWPPNSPDLNPLGYSIWSILEAKACAKPHKTIESLKRALIKAWNEITLEQLASIIDNFPKRLKACVEAKGGHYE